MLRFHSATDSYIGVVSAIHGNFLFEQSIYTIHYKVPWNIELYKSRSIKVGQLQREARNEWEENNIISICAICQLDVISFLFFGIGQTQVYFEIISSNFEFLTFSGGWALWNVHLQDGFETKWMTPSAYFHCWSDFPQLKILLAWTAIRHPLSSKSTFYPLCDLV